jgi:hypothetical protein
VLLTKLGVAFFHIIIAFFFAILVGWAVAVDGQLSSFTFMAGAFMGAMFYFIFIVLMVLIMEKWGGDDGLE